MPPALSESSRSRDSSIDYHGNRKISRKVVKNNKVTVVVEKANAFVNPQDIARIVCHREHEFLVQWVVPQFNGLPSSVQPYSWIRLEELRGPASSIYHVQNYVERLRTQHQNAAPSFLDIPSNAKKRKQSPLDVDETGSSSPRRSDIIPDLHLDLRKDYNCTRTVSARRITIQLSANGANDLASPTPSMLQRAQQTPLDWAEAAVQNEYNLMLATFAPKKPRIRYANTIDGGAPPLSVRLIDRYTYGSGVPAPDDHTLEGCQVTCRPNMVNNCGCEYSRTCSCLEFAEVDVAHLRPADEAIFAATEQDPSLSTMGLPKRFPYKMDGTMQAACLESTTRYALYECNKRCNCGPNCKTKVTQRGRKYGLEIFKTRNRGWGLRSTSDLRKGDFIDMYYGQVITYKEAGLRDNNEYLFDLDKFKDQLPGAEEMMLVVDGTETGGVTRFINHSCEPNCAIFPISYNKNDVLRYNLAFFALDKIPKGEELTFDYQGQLADNYVYDANDFEQTTPGSQKAAKNRIRCNCGTPSCRNYLFL